MSETELNINEDEYGITDKDDRVVAAGTGPTLGKEASVSFDIVGGDFVGRDQQIYTRDLYFVDGAQDSIRIERERLSEQIKTLRGRITRLIPAIELSKSLGFLKYRYEHRLHRAGFFRRFFYSFRRLDTDPAKNETFYYVNPREYLKRLGEIETKLSAEQNDLNDIYISEWDDVIDLGEYKMSESSDIPIIQGLSSLSDMVNVRIARLNSQFIGYVNQSAGSSEFLETQISKINHSELRNEAQTHYDAIDPLIKDVEPQKFTGSNFDVLSDQAYAAMGVLVEIENRKSKIESLIAQDKQRRRWTVAIVIAYIAFALTATIFIALTYGRNLTVGSLSELKMPLIGVPWPVIVWALIGSFAAMIHRFNKRPIHDFGDAFKWMLTRPVQGVVLGAAFYLVVVSGLFLFTGFSVQDAATSPVDEVILILAFLVGFSDRFADNVFNTLMQTISKPKPGDDEGNGKSHQNKVEE